MEIEPITIEAIFNLLRQRAAESKAPVIVDARIAVTPQEARLLNLQPIRVLEVIRF